MRRIEASLVLCGLVSACAGPAGMFGPPERAPFRDPQLTVEAARQAVVPGRSDKAELASRLGPAESVRFDSGWEVWAWRGQGGRGDNPELVVLFDPRGVVQKVRARPASPVPGR